MVPPCRGGTVGTVEFHGIMERYVDVADTSLPDYATNATKSLDAYYKFRVLSTKKF